MSNHIGRAALWLRWGVWYKIEDSVQWAWHYSTQCQYVALVEAIRDDRSVGMMRTPAYRWRWLARLVSRYTAFRLRDKGDEFRVRIVSPDRALALEAQYADWLALLQRGVVGT